MFFLFGSNHFFFKFSMQREAHLFSFGCLLKIPKTIRWNLDDLEKLSMEKEILAFVPPSYSKSESSDSFSSGRRDIISWGYNEHNTLLFYKEEGLPDFCRQICDVFEEELLEQPILRIHKQMPGQIIPLHVDTYNAYLNARKNIIDDDKNIVRYLIFLSDGGVGQFFQVCDRIFTGWSKGDVITWNKGAPHLSVNAGITSKWTLQITGIKKR
jgi:hypothetical protein